MAVVDFDTASAQTVTGPCGLSLGIPTFTFTLGVPSAALAKAIASLATGVSLPTPNLAFRLSCDPAKPVDIAASVPYGGGRTPNAPPDPSLVDDV